MDVVGDVDEVVLPTDGVVHDSAQVAGEAQDDQLLVLDTHDEHLVAAYPLSLEASEMMLRAGDVLWPGEYVPN